MMSDVKQYRLGNLPKEYPLIETYLGWLPVGFSSWWRLQENGPRFKRLEPMRITIMSPDGNEKVTLLMRQYLIKAAFPDNFFDEERTEDWWDFCIVSPIEKPEEEFIIPLH